MESEIREILVVESRLPNFKIRNTAPKIRNPSSVDKTSGIQYVESGIHCVESTTQDCLGLSYVGRNSG